jgi:hypothetical protein
MAVEDPSNTFSARTNERSHGPVIPGPLPQQAQGFLLQPRLLRHRQPEGPFDLARIERVLPQVEVPEQPALQRAEKKLLVMGLFNWRAALDGPCARWS